jgi:hypothetical protein
MTEYVPYYRCVPMAGGELILFLAKNDDMVEGEVIKMPRSLGNGVHGLESLQPARWGRFRRFGPDQKVPTTSELVEAVKKLSHQADLVLGGMLWQDFMRSVRVKSHVPHEPRRAVPLRLILSIIASIDVSVHWEVQFAFLLVVMLFTFSRSRSLTSPQMGLASSGAWLSTLKITRKHTPLTGRKWRACWANTKIS